LLTKIADDKEAKVSFSFRVWFTLSESIFASSTLRGTKVPANVTTTDRRKMKSNE
jgi:hypothetical protein